MILAQPRVRPFQTHDWRSCRTSLDRMEHWLTQPELLTLWHRALLTTQARLSLEAEGHVDVLAITLRSYQHMRAISEHIEQEEIYWFKLYSVDAHLAQRFLNDHGCMPFQRVRWSSSTQPGFNRSTIHRRGDMFPPFHVVRSSLNSQ